MKDCRKPWRLLTLFVLGAVLSLTYVERAPAFTLIEFQYLPAVQLPAVQSIQVSASNFSAATVSITINILNAAGGVVATKTVNVAANNTYVLRYTNGSSAAVYSAVVAASAAGSIASSLQAVGANGELVVIALPFIESSPMIQNTPAVRLVPGQSGMATVTNIGSTSNPFSLLVYNSTGGVVLSQSGQLLPFQTMSFSFKNGSTSNNAYRAVVTSQASNTVVSDVMTFDKTSGQVMTINWGDTCGK